MAKDNKNSPTRLPDELKVALRKKQAPWLARGEEPPSFGALLLEAWNLAESKQSNAAVPDAEKTEQLQPAKKRGSGR